MPELPRSVPATRRLLIALAAGAGLLAMAAALPACQTLRQVANLRQVRFAIDHVENAELAGIRLNGIRDPGDVNVGDLGQLGVALAQGELPMEFTLMLEAENPAENGQAARMVGMDWTLLLENQETISGTFNEDVTLPSGQVTTIPVQMRLDLLEFFDRGGRDLLELALAVAGVGGEPKDVSLRARPTVNTPIGPIRYPQPITINVGELGNGELRGRVGSES